MLVAKKLRGVSVLIVAALIAAVLMMSLPGSVSVTLARGDGDSSPGKPAYQIMIPNGVGSETGLQVFPPKLQADGRKDNWLSASHPYKDVKVGEYTYDDEGDCIAVDPSKGDIYVRETDNVLVITAGALSDKCKYDIEVVDYTLYGGETIWNEERQKNTVEELRARFRDYVYGLGSDLYQLEDVPQNDSLSHIDGIQKVSIYAYVKAQDRATKATASTKIMLGGENYNGTDIALNSSEQRIVTEYSTNPYTRKPWLWADMNDLQAGITLKDAECSFVYVELEFSVHSQTFFPITPVEVTPGTANAWTDVNVSSYVPSGATGVILHIVNNSPSTGGTDYNVGIQKNGSTDNRSGYSIYQSSHLWAATGVDADRIFEAYVGSTSSIDIYLVGYTMSGVTFFTNSSDYFLTTINAWTDIDCATQAPNAIGLIFEGTSGSNYPFGLRKNGSNDNRTGYIRYHLWAMVGCDASQVCEGYGGNKTLEKFSLIGYITDGCTFNTNATDVSLSTTGSWQDLPALPANSVMGFIEVNASAAANYGLRQNGSSEEIYYYSFYHPWAFVECDDSYIIEGKIANTAVDFFVVGYATAPPPAPEVTAVGLYETNHTTPVTNMDPQTEYAVKVSVTDYDKLSDLSTVNVTLYHDNDGTYSAGEVPTSGDTQTCAILTCNVGATPGWSIDPSADTSWELVDGNCVQPDLDLTSGDFWFHFKPGKVATETVAPAKWHIHVVADDGVYTGTGYQDNREMNWYGEISTPSPDTAAWGEVTPGTDFGTSTRQGAISITYIANGDYDQKVKTTATWSGNPSGTATLDPSGNCTNANQFALKADDTDVLDNAVLVDTSGVSIDATGDQTDETGDTKASNTLWLKLASGFSKATYSGTITYTIENR